MDNRGDNNAGYTYIEWISIASYEKVETKKYSAQKLLQLLLLAVRYTEVKFDSIFTGKGRNKKN